jgi:hypothetical protein
MMQYYVGLCLCYAKILLYGWLLLCPWLSWAQTEAAEERVYEDIKLRLMCRATQLLIKGTRPTGEVAELPHPDCQSIRALEASLTEARTQRFVALFKDKYYRSYGRNKLRQRLDKLIDDMVAYLRSIDRNDAVWVESVRVLAIELRTLKDDSLYQITQPNDSIQAQNNIPPHSSARKQAQSSNPMIVYIILLILAACAGFLAYQNQQLRKQLEGLEADFQEKYSRLDNRLDTMTPIKEHKALILRVNYISEQINAQQQELDYFLQGNAPAQKPQPPTDYPQEEQLKATPQAPAPQPIEVLDLHPERQVYYGAPQEDVFDSKRFLTEPDALHCYKIEIDLQNPELASYTIVARPEYQQQVLNHPEELLSPFCEYTHQPEEARRVLNLEPGTLEKQDGHWRVIKKIKVAFE